MIQIPQKGEPLRADWAAQITGRVNSLAPIGSPGMLVRDGIGGFGSEPCPSNRRDRRGAGASPHPFEIRWAKSLNDGEGGWIVWLPTGNELIVDGVAVDLTEDLEAAGDPYPEGWYALGLELAEGGDVWLNVTIPATGESEAEFADEEDDGSEASEGDQITPVLVAKIDVDDETDAKTIRQNLVGALALGRQPDETEDKPYKPTPFMVGTYERDAEEGEEGDENGKVVVSGIVNCKFYWDGVETTVANFPLPSGDATVYLRCVGTVSQSASAINGYTWDFSLGTSAVNEGGSIYRNYKLYDFEGGKVSMDWRDTFLALFSDTVDQLVPDGISIDRIPDAAPGSEPDGDEGKLEIKGFKWATSSVETLSSNQATTMEFLARTPASGNNPASLVFRKLKSPTVALPLDKEFQLGGTKIADIAASVNINITQKTIVGDTASGIDVSETNGIITIRYIGGSGGTSGYTGTRTILADVGYDTSTKRLRRRYITEIWADGVLTSQTLGSWEDYHQAVQETV